MKELLSLTLVIFCLESFCQEPLKKQLRVERTQIGVVVRFFPPAADSTVWTYKGRTVNADTAAWLDFEKNNNQDSLYVPVLPTGFGYYTLDRRYSWFPRFVPQVRNDCDSLKVSSKTQ